MLSSSTTYLKPCRRTFQSPICQGLSKYRTRGVLQSSGSVVDVSFKLSQLLKILDPLVSDSETSSFAKTDFRTLHQIKPEHPVWQTGTSDFSEYTVFLDLIKNLMLAMLNNSSLCFHL
jgi:hypothetical protein